VVLGLAQLGVAIAVRARRVPGGERNRMLPVALLVAAGLQLAGVLLPGLRDLLGTTPLSASDLGWCLIAAAVPALVLAVARRHRIT
jgi:Ca2+-transporting ATPase